MPNAYGRLLRLLSEFLKPLPGRTRSPGKCWATILLSHRPAPSSHAVHGEVDGLDIGGQHGRRFVLLRHTHRPQRRPYLICVKQERKRPTPVRKRLSRTQALLGRVIPGGWVPVSATKMRSLVGLWAWCRHTKNDCFKVKLRIVDYFCLSCRAAFSKSA